MIIYEQEKKDGLEELLLAKASIQFESEVKPDLEIAKAFVKNESRDIFGMESILVSVGWNNNDDVFDRLETWRARSTPINKKFNFMHNEKDIIGHITKAFVLDKDGNVIPDDTPEEELPEFFEIGVSSIMYTVWQDKELQERACALMSEIPEGKWYVSMEVLFPKFDYALSKGSEQKIIERNADTSFLTKYLKVYNGKGEYEGWKVGRRLKDMFFSGKGLVDNPANKRSLITSFNFNGAQASTSIFNEVKMSFEQKDYDKAVVDLGIANKDLQSAAKEKEMLSEQVNTLKGDLESSKAFTKELQDNIKKLEEEMSGKDGKLAEVNKALAEMISKAKDQERVSQLVSEGVAKEKAEEIATKFSKASDEMFEEVVALHKSKAKTIVQSETDKLDSTTASTDEKAPPQETEVDEADKLLEASKAFILETLKRGDK